jgi:pimeloyl-ACP methyl ester carboxylesterase
MRRPVVLRPVGGIITLALVTLTVVGGPVGTAGAALTTTLTRHSFTLKSRSSSGSTAYTLDYWSNGKIGTVNRAVRRVVVILHGDSRNAEDYGRYTVSAAKAARVASSTMVVAPLFVADVDHPRSNQLYWTEDSWKRGGQSETAGRAWTMSSFRVMGAVLAALRSDYPRARVVLAGHSAGGQFVQRYAGSNAAHVANRYVPMNPGSYAYLNGRRWSKGKLRMLKPREVKACPHYNTYRYGLKGRPTTVFSTRRATVISRYLASRVTYLLGEADTVRDSTMDTSCEANWEGKNRFQRGTRFFRALKAMAGSARHHHLVTVPRVAHEGSKMIESRKAVRPLFGIHRRR